MIVRKVESGWFLRSCGSGVRLIALLKLGGSVMEGERILCRKICGLSFWAFSLSLLSIVTLLYRHASFRKRKVVVVVPELRSIDACDSKV